MRKPLNIVAALHKASLARHTVSELESPCPHCYGTEFVRDTYTASWLCADCLADVPAPNF